jgi:hypothetical protein
MPLFLIIYDPKDTYVSWLEQQLVSEDHTIDKKTIEEYDDGDVEWDKIKPEVIVFNARIRGDDIIRNLNFAKELSAECKREGVVPRYLVYDSKAEPRVFEDELRRKLSPYKTFKYINQSRDERYLKFALDALLR